MDRKILDEVKVVIYGFKTFGEAHFAEEFFKILEDANPAFHPTKIGMHEPINKPFSIADASKMWVDSQIFYKDFGDIFFKGSKYHGNVTWKLTDNSNSIGFYPSRDLVIKNNGTEKFIDMVKKMFLWANGVWGYACHSSNPMYTPGLTFRTCIGGIPWLALFGPPYVKMFGRELIETVPCKVEEFAKDRFMFLTSDEPMPLTCELQEKQSRVKEHLGEDAFCRYDRPTRLTLEDIKAGKDRPSTDGYRSPDLSAYLINNNEKEAVVKSIEEKTVSDSQQSSIQNEYTAFIRKTHPEIKLIAEKEGSVVLKVGAGEIENFVDNIRKACENADSLDEREQIYERFLRALPKENEESSFKAHGNSIMPRLAPVSILAELATIGTIPHRPFADTGLIITYVFDFPDKVMYLTNKHLAQLDLDEDSLHSLAMTNIGKTFPAEAVAKVLKRQASYAVKTMDSHDAARVLLVPEYLPEGAEVAALIPDRDTLVIAAVPADGNWKKLKKLAQAASGRPLFKNPLLISKNGFTTIY